MNEPIRQLEPKSLWNHFADLSAIPRPSKREERAIQFVYDFGMSLGLDTYRDEVGNVIIRKPATQGKENGIPVILQAHVDMVPQKNNDVVFDFDTMGIRMFIDGDWVKAEGTTLGADNGIGVAAAMNVLSSSEVAHPPLEVLFTMDEETGMTGAKALKAGLLKGKILLNLDSEDEHELTIGCAGGIDVSIKMGYKEKKVKKGYVSFAITIKGLKGGHSGMEIHIGRGNANKIMNRILWQANKKFDILIGHIDGGGLRNAIPRESEAILCVKQKQERAFLTFIEEERKILMDEYKTTDPDLSVLLEACAEPVSVLGKRKAESLLSAIYANQNGIYRMSPDVDDLVQTSNNLARVKVIHGSIDIQNLTRSAVDSEKMDLAYAIQACWENVGGKVTMEGSYPGWAPDPHALINELMTRVFESSYGQKPKIMACHAGLECGIIKENYRDVDMISFGPNIRGPHSPDEKVQISSVGRFWELLKKTLDSIPELNS